MRRFKLKFGPKPQAQEKPKLESPSEEAIYSKELRYNGGIIWVRRAISQCIWKCSERENKLTCSLCDEPISHLLIEAYRSTYAGGSLPFIRCTCEAYLGIEGIERDLYDNDQYNSTIHQSFCEVCECGTKRTWFNSNFRVYENPNVHVSIQTEPEDDRDLSHPKSESASCSSSHNISLSYIEMAKGSEEEQSLSEKLELIQIKGESKRPLKEPPPSEVEACKRFVAETCIIVPSNERLRYVVSSTSIREKYMKWLLLQDRMAPMGRNAFYNQMDALLGKRVSSKYYGVRFKE